MAPDKTQTIFEACHAVAEAHKGDVAIGFSFIEHGAMKGDEGFSGVYAQTPLETVLVAAQMVAGAASLLRDEPQLDGLMRYLIHTAKLLTAAVGTTVGTEDVDLRKGRQ